MVQKGEDYAFSYKHKKKVSHKHKKLTVSDISFTREFVDFTVNAALKYTVGFALIKSNRSKSHLIFSYIFNYCLAASVSKR